LPENFGQDVCDVDDHRLRRVERVKRDQSINERLCCFTEVLLQLAQAPEQIVSLDLTQRSVVSLQFISPVNKKRTVCTTPSTKMIVVQIAASQPLTRT